LEDSQQTQEKVGHIQQAEQKLTEIQSEEATIKARIADHQKYIKEEEDKLNKELAQKKTTIQEQFSIEMKNVEKYRAEALAEKSAAEKSKNETNSLRENNAKLINELEAEILAHEKDLVDLHKIRADIQSEKEKILSGIAEEKIIKEQEKEKIFNKISEEISQEEQRKQQLKMERSQQEEELNKSRIELDTIRTEILAAENKKKELKSIDGEISRLQSEQNRFSQAVTEEERKYAEISKSFQEKIDKIQFEEKEILQKEEKLKLTKEKLLEEMKLQEQQEIEQQQKKKNYLKFQKI